VDTVGNGHVHVTVPEGASDCSHMCSQQVADGEPVMLAPEADPGWFFDHWSDGCSGSFTMMGSKTCTATFSLLPPTPFPVDLDVTGLGTGDVTTDQMEFDCTGTCVGTTKSFLAGTVIIFTAAVGDGDSFFAGWQGDCAMAGTNLTAMITVTRHMSCTAD